jgi:hypothetical protein
VVTFQLTRKRSATAGGVVHRCGLRVEFHEIEEPSLPAVRCIGWLGDFAWHVWWRGETIQDFITGVKHSISELAINGFEPNILLAQCLAIPMQPLRACRQIACGSRVLGEYWEVQRLEGLKPAKNAGDARATMRQTGLVGDYSPRCANQLFQIRCALVGVGHGEDVLVT